MTDEEAADIEATWHKFRRVELYRGDPDSERKLADALLNHIPALLAERTVLLDERAAVMEIVRAVAEATITISLDGQPVAFDINAAWPQLKEQARALLAEMKTEA